VLAGARALAEEHARSARRLACKGLAWAEVCERVEAAVRPEDGQALDAICAQVCEYEDRDSPDVHGFMLWLRLLQEGHSSLPDPIPAGLLAAWRDLWAGWAGGWELREGRWRHSGPTPMWRCADCLLCLPHGAPPPFRGRCPACRSDQIAVKNLSVSGWGEFRPVGEF
jgi:hypothetical protein